jgi:Flp pilus assembly pilin Flp
VVERMLWKLVDLFRRNDKGQDLAEYCLITAIVALVGLGICYQLSGGFQNLWGTANTAMVAANSSASPGAAVQGSGPVNH